jgi:surfactin family lipopeptide synthetase A
MQGTANFEDAKRSLFDKLLRGEVPPLRSETSKIARRRSCAPAPLSYSQEQVYLQAQLAGRLAADSCPYHETITVHRSGQLDVQVLQHCLTEILRRHEAWRTTFEPMNGKVVQFVHAVPELHLDVVDLCDLPDSEVERTAIEIAQKSAQEPFDLAKGPLVRFQLVRLQEQEYRLFLTAHQIIIDGVSTCQIFFPELVTLYEAYVSGEPSPLPEPQVQYSDYAQWQRETLENQPFLEHLSYWQKQLAGCFDAPQMPTDHLRRPVQTFRGAIQPFAIPKSLSDAAKALTRAEGTTFFVILLAAFTTLLHSYTGEEEIVIGTLAHTRNCSEVQHLLGYFLNPVVLCLRLAGNPSFRGVLERVREAALGALSHDEMPFHLLVAAMHSDADLNRHPFYQVQFSLAPPIPTQYPGWNLTPMDLQSGGAKLDLYFELEDRPEEILGRVQYNTDLFEAASIERMVRHYQVLLEAVTADPDKRLSQLPHCSFSSESVRPRDT